MYKAVIFDLYGTLVPNLSRHAYQQSLHEMASILGISAEVFIEHWYATAAQRSTGTFRSFEENAAHICQAIGTSATAARIAQAREIRVGYVTSEFVPLEGAVNVLTRLKERSYKTGMVSECSTIIPELWPRTVFSGRFDVTIFSCNTGLRKPDPTLFSMAAAQLQIATGECLYVGDGDGRELSGARIAGMHPVLFRSPDEPEDALVFDREEWDGDRISSYNELLELVNHEV